MSLADVTGNPRTWPLGLCQPYHQVFASKTQVPRRGSLGDTFVPSSCPNYAVSGISYGLSFAYKSVLAENPREIRLVLQSKS
jgi:hypothetical protein